MCRIALSLAVADRPDVLPRVVTTCRRRGAQIVGMTYAGGDRHRPGRIDLAVDIDPRLRRQLACRLEALVGVEEVAERAG